MESGSGHKEATAIPEVGEIDWVSIFVYIFRIIQCIVAFIVLPSDIVQAVKVIGNVRDGRRDNACVEGDKKDG